MRISRKSSGFFAITLINSFLLVGERWDSLTQKEMPVKITFAPVISGDTLVLRISAALADQSPSPDITQLFTNHTPPNIEISHKRERNIRTEAITDAQNRRFGIFQYRRYAVYLDHETGIWLAEANHYGDAMRELMELGI